MLFRSEPYGLKIKSEDIQDFLHNSTRFLMLSKYELPSLSHGQSDFKTSLVLRAENSPGALYGILGPFASLGFDLTRLESRPSKTVAWEYIFFIDFLGDYQALEDSGLFSQLDNIQHHPVPGSMSVPKQTNSSASVSVRPTAARHITGGLLMR